MSIPNMVPPRASHRALVSDGTRSGFHPTGFDRSRVTSWDIGEQSAGKAVPKFGAKAPASASAEQDRPRLIQAEIAKLTRIAVPANLDRYPPGWTAGDKLAFEQRWRVGDWPCPRCGLIGCDHDDDLPPYRGAFHTEGRH